MKIACLGWGSLIWNPGELKIQRKWFQDGPILPVEFTRVSRDGRMTLVIDKNKDTRPVRVLWSLMNANDLEEAKESLGDREDTSGNKILSVTVDENVGTDNLKLKVQNWLKFKDIEAVIWTGLSWRSEKNKKCFNGKRPNKKQVVDYLSSLEGEERNRAEYYIRKAPKQIDTYYRREIEARFGWAPED